MADNTFKLTNENVRTRCAPPGPGEVTASGRSVRQRIYWDAELKGFGCLVGARAKSFIMQRDVMGRSVRTTIGRFPTWTADQARKRARELAVGFDKGVDPNAAAREAAQQERAAEWKRFTLAEAIDEHAANMKTTGCAERSIKDMRKTLERLAPEWLNKPLLTIRRADCIQRHRKITEKHGPYSANHFARALRACWGSAQKLWEELPAHPVIGVTFNKERRRREPIGWDAVNKRANWNKLAEWWVKVQAIQNPIRRDLQWFILFTGLRATDAATVRWEHVDLADGTIFRPNPKGGEDSAFRVPVCEFVMGILERRKRDNAKDFGDDKGWVFPGPGKAGHVADVKEQRYCEGADGNKRKGPLHIPSPHRSRDTFATACLEAGVGTFEKKILMNHTLPQSDVTEGYQRPSTEHMRWCIERVAAFLLGKAGQTAHSGAAKKVGA